MGPLGRRRAMGRFEFGFRRAQPGILPRRRRAPAGAGPPFREVAMKRRAARPLRLQVVAGRGAWVVELVSAVAASAPARFGPGARTQEVRAPSRAGGDALRAAFCGWRETRRPRWPLAGCRRPFGRVGSSRPPGARVNRTCAGLAGLACKRAPRSGPEGRNPPAVTARVETWLILPVVICLSQRLSHACLSLSDFTSKLRMAH